MSELGPVLSKELSSEHQTALAAWNARLVNDREAMAFGVEAKVESVVSLLTTGHGVVLVGARGVGKTAIARESARRWRQRGHHYPVIQLSIRRRQAKCRDPNELTEAFESLTEALVAAKCLPFFEDGDLFRAGLAEPLIGLISRLNGPVLLEGTPAAINALFEDEESLDEHLIRLPIEEPDVESTQDILQQLFDKHPSRFEATPSQTAIEEAVYLGQRFLSRSQFPRKAIDLISQACAKSPTHALDREHVLARFCELHETPRWLVDPRAPLNFGDLESNLQNEVLGQPDAIAAASRLVATMKTGLSDLRRPFGTFLFTGPTGVGKTHLAQTLAHILFGGRERMVRINMGDYAADIGTKLFGEPDAYSMASRRGYLTQTLLGRQFAVLLLDELEKAHPAIFDRLLPLMDEGTFTNGAGEAISCRSMIIIATTNAGSEAYRGAGLGFAGEQNLKEKRRLVDQRVRDIFRFEFLNRFDAVVHFDPLSREACRQIAHRELNGLRERVGLRRYGLELSIDEAVLDWLAVHGYHPDFGARFMKRTIERSVTRILAETIVRRRPPHGSHVELLVRGRQIYCRVEAQKDTTNRPQVTIDTSRQSSTSITASELMARTRPLLSALQKYEAERSQLLADMGQPQFWNGADKEDILDRFREVDIWVNIARRFAHHIEDWQKSPSEGKNFSSAINALIKWEERERLSGPTGIWLVLTAVDIHDPAESWLRKLVRIQKMYCHRCDLEAHIEAVEPHPKGICRAVLEVEGPGALHLLSAEIGLHRLRISSGPDAVVRIDIITRGEQSEPRSKRVIRRKDADFGLALDFETSFEVPRLGLVSRLWGRSEATLFLLAKDMEAALAQEGQEATPSRLYGGEASVVSDPRTGAQASWSQVVEGQLDTFFTSWHKRKLAPSLKNTWS